ncbi:MAG: hydantoinase/oxoprolinase family protein [Mesorhizobium sp.]|uniref:hydantoinase/oxoprolinase family protein n=1 Tax=Mesorhizobium sp. TaxID=1871066 RepID=UPI001AC1CA75|nr:hydantoinase/oxoprolinase family protein [Mesorhizobium sp.]MBN9217730.1 hydantoinase/oxoprolinase family protein [Mesorhizobium sp.]
MTYRISVDTGGTFTDVVVNDGNGNFSIGKSLTTPDRIFEGMRNAMVNVAQDMSTSLEDLLENTSLLIYGTTRATNAIVTKTVAKTALLTTQGFPDVLVLKEGGKFNPHDFSQDYPHPYLPRRHTFEIEERVGSEGQIIIPLNIEEAGRTIGRLGEQNFEAIAVCLLWSIADPSHELQLGALIEEMLPGVPYTLSHQLISVVREYRRASATAIDASLKPLMQAHLRDLEGDLRLAGYQGEVLVSTAAGGCSSIDALIEKPIYTVGSGPAMAPIAARTYSAMEGMGEDVIVCDTGGTTFDVGVVRDGRLTFSRDTWLGPRYTGDLLGISAVDMRSIGAGGGSIAWIDDGGLMRVGPMSAGSVPGPACYGRGGTKPTVSDAAVVLGYFDPDYFLGGRMKLDVEAARHAVHGVALQIGLTIEETAFRILGLASDLMVRAIGDVTINEGVNPRESTIVAGGGAAGVNIMLIARELGCGKVILPGSASALSAAGMQFANIVAEEAQSLVTLSNRFDAVRVNEVFDELENKLDAFRRKLPGRGDAYAIERIGEARYLGQIWELDTPLPMDRFFGDDDLAAYVGAFHDVHERVFAVRDPNSPIETVSWKARLKVALSEPPVPAPSVEFSEVKPGAATRPCFFGGKTPLEVPIYKPGDLAPGSRIQGPAIIEETTTTLVVYPDMAVSISGNGNYLLEIA